MSMSFSKGLSPERLVFPGLRGMVLAYVAVAVAAQGQPHNDSGTYGARRPIAVFSTDPHVRMACVWPVWLRAPPRLPNVLPSLLLRGSESTGADPSESSEHHAWKGHPLRVRDNIANGGRAYSTG